MNNGTLYSFNYIIMGIEIIALEFTGFTLHGFPSFTPLYTSMTLTFV